MFALQGGFAGACQSTVLGSHIHAGVRFSLLLTVMRWKFIGSISLRFEFGGFYQPGQMGYPTIPLRSRRTYPTWMAVLRWILAVVLVCLL